MYSRGGTTTNATDYTPWFAPQNQFFYPVERDKFGKEIKSGDFLLSYEYCGIEIYYVISTYGVGNLDNIRNVGYFVALQATIFSYPVVVLNPTPELKELYERYRAVKK